VIEGIGCALKISLFTLLVNKEWKRAITDPSNSVPASVLKVMGENDLQKMFSQTLLAINKDIPWPMP